MSEVIVITSGKGGVGKTTTVANIGTGLAAMGKRVAVVDTDIGLRNLDVVMGLENRIVYNLVDVINGSCRLKPVSYTHLDVYKRQAYTLTDVRSIFPKEIGDSIEAGIHAFGKKLSGFDRPDVLLEGVESRTSSPVRIVREPKKLTSNIEGIYPCGEGAGYAGGITSAAMDGLKVAEAVASVYALPINKM